ncbi:uncharacterized protein CC84DRAFT_1133255 [Paraphaeosphaeria sporulosa]|uniref:Uncharacterized protein n=1 Tax=Paraphaeosphaeria sporulosa TaxID=1460663 RepID=A0A177CWP0_9PLEO|nr:uncharacterized protein CC84DRAFT_1133255 [Paraphaeosphaeria sporulosa]OAG11458.1 hypothetical protein CC84DRAFT_1133255 [Paraphaeosphaeria sporulosa]
MAAFALPDPAHPIATSYLERPLPTGPCSHRDVVGTCGCEQFWDAGSADIYHGSNQYRSGSQRSTVCVCGHHACYHKPAVAAAAARAPLYDGRCHTHSGTQCDLHKAGGMPRDLSQPLNSPPPRTIPTQLLMRNEASLANGSRVDNGTKDPPSQPSSSGLPRIPSICLMSNDRYPAANSAARDQANQSRQTIAGLGLSMLNVGDAARSFDGQQSVSSTVPDELDLGQPLDGTRAESRQPSAGQNSMRGEQGQSENAALGPLDAILEFNRNFHLDVGGDTIPNSFNLDDFVQSATEVATPSIRNTPDLAVTDQAVQDGKRAIEDLIRMTSGASQQHAADDRPASAASAPPQLLLTNSPHTSQEHVQNFLKTASPQSLQKLVSYLPSLYNLLNSIPNVANALKELNDRLSHLESNNSFNYVHPDDLHHQFDHVDGRLLHLESRMDDHDTLHQTIDADNSSLSYSRRRIAPVSGSFQSIRSLESTTSSALILAAMDRKETETEISGIKDRLDVLETFAMPPTLTKPWEIEVVLLPWGRDLRGIWFSPDESMHDQSNPTTQDSEGWTQARSSTHRQSSAPVPLRETDSSPYPASRHSSRSSHPFSDTESGWSSQAISNWASGLTEELLSPKACKSTNLVHKRLRSRGLVKDVTLHSASSRDIQLALAHAFKDMLEHLKYTDEDDEPTIRSYPGLRASFIPLRKVRHDSKLHFLTPAEMSSSALWSAQFLSADVIMHVTGGKKRLYVTQREAYVQSHDETGSSWTWQELRELPRYRPEADVRMEANDGQHHPQVAEADAKEACWTYFEAYDAPPRSVNSSFGSHHSVELSMRPADRSWRRSITPASILKNPMPQPISPLSENHPRRPSYARQRTVSASVLEPANASSSKRRMDGSPVKHSSQPHSLRAPSASLPRMKRRRVSKSTSPRPALDADENATDVHVTAWANTPRRSREPFSPFFSSVAAPLPRTASDLASRPSQRSLAGTSKGTPFAYATPHSGPLVGGPVFVGDGDTEADEDLYQDDDGEQSWRGVATGEEDNDLIEDVEMGAEEELASFSLGSVSSIHDCDINNESDGDSDSDEADADSGYAAQRTDAEDEDEDDDPLDALLGILQD